MKPARGKRVPTRTRKPTKAASKPAAPPTIPAPALPPAAAHERLVCFLYLLLRDTVAAGEVARLLHETMPDVDKADAKYSYSNKHLEAYAREVASKLSSDA